MNPANRHALSRTQSYVYAPNMPTPGVAWKLQDLDKCLFIIITILMKRNLRIRGV